VAVVAGASRGGGRGIAVELGAAGATVYVTGRTRRQGPPPTDGAAGTIEDTADEVTAAGGKGIAVALDLTSEREVAALFERVAREQGRLDVLANAVWGGNEAIGANTWSLPFWDEPPEAWQRTMGAGAHAAWLSSRHAARPMIATRRGLIVHVTDGVAADGTRPVLGPLSWDAAHACIDRMTLAMSRDLRPHNVAVLALMPGFMRTERVLMHMRTEEAKQAMGFDRSETPAYLGRAVAALAADPHVISRTGTVTFVADLARAYGFTDTDGRQPPRFAFT
jgi:NAD(P)-dependent dehydrogenase (short-subunit alcohol dehydrogenase family)